MESVPKIAVASAKPAEAAVREIAASQLFWIEPVHSNCFGRDDDNQIDHTDDRAGRKIRSPMSAKPSLWSQTIDRPGGRLAGKAVAFATAALTLAAFLLRRCRPGLETSEASEITDRSSLGVARKSVVPVGRGRTCAAVFGNEQYR